MMSARKHLLGLTLSLLPGLALLGCKPDAALHRSEAIDNAASTHPNASPLTANSIPSSGAGVIQGTVRFTGKPPARVRIDMSMDPACSLAGDNLSEQYVVAGGKLANVFVFVKSGAPAAAAPAGTPPVVLDQKGCRYIPHVVAVQQGGTVQFRNSDPTMHNIHTMPAGGNAPVDVSQGPGGQPQNQQFNTPELMMPVRCNNHPWMNAFINVSPSSYFAVSSADGSFTIQGLPPGAYTLAAVHEKLGEQDIQVTVPANGTAKADFSFAAK